jgi:hypothetical protein
VPHYLSRSFWCKLNAFPGPPFWKPTGTHDFFTYFWLNDRDLIVAEGHNMGVVRVVKLDSTNGRRWRVARLGRGLIGERITYHNLFIPCIVSPDGHWLLGYYDANPEPGSYDVLGVGNSQCKKWLERDTLTDDLHWMQDNSHWFYWDPEKRSLLMYSLDGQAPKAVRPSGLPKPIANDKSFENSSSTVGVTRDGQIVLMLGSSEVIGERCALYRFPAKDGAEAKRIDSLRSPIDGSMKNLTLSPMGDRLAWIIEANNTSEWQKNSIWTSDIDGGRRIEIGYLYLNIGHVTAATLSDLEDLQWTPDGRNVSFIYKNNVWTAPAR